MSYVVSQKEGVKTSDGCAFTVEGEDEGTGGAGRMLLLMWERGEKKKKGRRGKNCEIRSENDKRTCKRSR